MTDLPKEWIAKLNVDAESLCAGLKLIKKFTGLGRRSVPLAYSDCQLEVEFGDYVFYVDAEGDWNGVAMVPAKEMRQWSRRLPIGRTTVPIYVIEEGTVLWTPTSLMRCEWKASTK